MKTSFLDSPIEYLKGVGPAKGELLRKEIGVFTIRDLLFNFPFRYIDKTKFHEIGGLGEFSGEVQIKGVLRRMEVLGGSRKQRLTAQIRDTTGAIELVWFRSIHFLKKNLEVGKEYVVYGKVNQFGRSLNIAHPEMEAVNDRNVKNEATFAPVYPSTEKLNSRGLDSKGRRKLLRTLFEKVSPNELSENLRTDFIDKMRFPSHYEALKAIHFPRSKPELDHATKRLKFEELFFLQLRLLHIKGKRKQQIKGFQFKQVGEYFNRFYSEKLPFDLTGAQKRVIKEIRHDMRIGVQMNRLLQGDVGSGKTIVALLCMLIALDNGFQSCLMAPTEILAQQHFQSITDYVGDLGVNVGFLSGSIKGKKRKAILEKLEAGEIDILIGTHALIEDWVIFKKLGFSIIDEQHRFGVAQRSRLWQKSKPFPPHVLVMSATPIPRTLAMTLYGDLDVSVIDELPPGRKEVVTEHRTENHRLRVLGFIKKEIEKGRQVYIVYPLIEESEKLDLANLMEGYEAISREFPKPRYQLSIVHGRMKSVDKDYEMKRFVEGQTQIMVATTVIEVGVNVPNATVMVIENTERFGLSQLHQLRGRVGRGGDQSYCILMSSFKLSEEGRERIQTMCRTNNGFEIAEADMRLRGPGNIEGTQQSGILNFNIADLARDGQILKTARALASDVLEEDPNLALPINAPLQKYMAQHYKDIKVWSRIS